MVVSAERRAVREPGASPGRSRRCEGRRSPAKSHWREPGRRRQREPRVRRPAVRRNRTPRGRRIRVPTLPRSPGGAGRHVRARSGDPVLWYWATFTGPAGPLTLEVETSIVKGKRCFFATGRNDAGRASRVRGVVYTLNSRRTSSATGVVCTRPGRYTVRVTKTGAI